MRVGILTSSRADYSIYRPLLKDMSAHPEFEVFIFAFGSHLSHFHGYTLAAIAEDGFGEIIPIESLLTGDSPEAISSSMGLTTLKFSAVWKQFEHIIDLYICLGDRYEMFAAVSAMLPFNLPLAHIHGGETTLGAIDNTFRHAITLMAEYHFVSTPIYGEKVEQLKGNKANIWHVGALGLDNLKQLDLLKEDEFKQAFNIDLNKASILMTFHPETIEPEKNAYFIEEVKHALKEVDSHDIVITMPNADTAGNQLRQRLNGFISENAHVHSVESFGTVGYMTMMKHSSFLLGNTSSGIIEAASFGKYVINLGDRQKGRACSENVFHTQIQKDAILQSIQEVSQMGDYIGDNIYWNGGASSKIMNILQQMQHG